MDPTLRARYEEFLTSKYGLTYASTQAQPGDIELFAALLAGSPFAETFEEIRGGITEELGLVIALGYQWHWNIETAAHLYLDENDFQETGLDYWSRMRGAVQGVLRALLPKSPRDGPASGGASEGNDPQREILLDLAPLLMTRLQLTDSGRGMALCLALLALKIGFQSFAEQEMPEEP